MAGSEPNLVIATVPGDEDAKAPMLHHAGGSDGRTAIRASWTGPSDDLLGAVAGLPRILRQEHGRQPELPRQVSPIQSGVHGERLLGKQSRRQAMRFHAAVAAIGDRAALAPVSLAPGQLSHSAFERPPTETQRHLYGAGKLSIEEWRLSRFRRFFFRKATLAYRGQVSHAPFTKSSHGRPRERCDPGGEGNGPIPVSSSVFSSGLRFASFSRRAFAIAGNIDLSAA
jgi:hypothetical protein